MTQDVDFAYRLATRAVVFSHGEIISDADIHEVFASKKVLSKAGLKKPLIYEAAELIENHLPGNKSSRKPRDIGELQDYVNYLNKLV